nr:hypothetical protein [Anaerolineae bacterium]
MSTAEERLKILNMVAEGKISAEEGAQLLKALQSASGKSQSSPTSPSMAEPRFLRVRVTSSDTGRVKAHINIPLGLINAGMRMGARFAPELDGFDFQEVMQAIQEGQHGKIIDAQDDIEGERVEIFVE